MIRIGDFVTRKSYGNDIVFKVVGIEGNNCFLYGSCIRLSADSPLQDLVLYDKEIDDYDACGSHACGGSRRGAHIT